MKYLFLIFAPLIFGQGPTKDFSPREDFPPYKNGKCFYQEVIEIEGVTQNQLFKRASNWVVGAYVSAPDVINQQDPEQGRIVTKGYFTVNYVMNVLPTYHTLTLEMKEGRYRYTLTEFYFTNGSGRTINIEDHTKGFRKKVNKEVKELIADLKRAMATEAEDW